MRATDFAQGGVQLVAVAVRRELVVQIEVEPVTTQTDDPLASTRPDRDESAELAACFRTNDAAGLVADHRRGRSGPAELRLTLDCEAFIPQPR